jgi:hypothetical protein
MVHTCLKEFQKFNIQGIKKKVSDKRREEDEKR